MAERLAVAVGAGFALFPGPHILELVTASAQTGLTHKIIGYSHVPEIVPATRDPDLLGTIALVRAGVALDCAGAAVEGIVSQLK